MLKPARLGLGGVVAALAWIAARAGGLDPDIAATIAVTALTATWWITEAMPIPAASLTPLALFPLVGVLDQRQAASALGSYVIVLLMASFMLSKSLERSGLHERLAVGMIRLTGSSGRSLVFGFMVAAAVLSMWISNTATTLMLSTMALSIIARGSGDLELDDADRLAAPLLMGIAFAASLGGVGTLIGTPPNLIFLDAYQKATGEEYAFLDWMAVGVPVVAVGVPIMALWLTRGLGGVAAPELPTPGAWRTDEKRVMVVFGVAILAWVTRTGPFGGWSALFDIGLAGDSTVAVAAVVVMFLVPNGRGGALLDWETANDIPWGMLLLFAGGICIATAFRESGLSTLIGEALARLIGGEPFLTILAMCLAVTFLTEITSNTATANLLMPVLAAVATSEGLPPALLMAPAAIACSCAFMLPVATAPNAIIYATGRVPIARMAREGVVLNVMIAVATAVITSQLLR
ncbi:MAG: SLC13 family permease [Pseudomonadota bacterium]